MSGKAQSFERAKEEKERAKAMEFSVMAGWLPKKGCLEFEVWGVLHVGWTRGVLTEACDLDKTS